jgi:hypothetical protein
MAPKRCLIPRAAGPSGPAGRIPAHDDEESDEWHTAFGGGLFFAVLSRSTAFSPSVARSDEHTSVLLTSGFWL